MSLAEVAARRDLLNSKQSHDSVAGLLGKAQDWQVAEPQQALELVRLVRHHPHATRLEQAKAYLLEATITYQQGDLECAHLCVTEGLSLYATLAEPQDEMESTLLLGRIYRDLGQLDAASEQFQQALALAKQLGQATVEADALNLQASVCMEQGFYLQALDKLEASLHLVRALELTDREARILNNIGNLQTTLGNYPQAMESLLRSYDILQTPTAEPHIRTHNLINLGWLYQEMNDLSQARVFYAEARVVARQAQDTLLEGAALNNLANLDAREKNWSVARTHFQAALEIARRVGARQHELDNLDGLGQVYVAQGEFQKAAETHGAVLTVAQDLGDHEAELDALLNLGKDFLAMRQPAAALGYLTRGQDIAERVGRQPSVLESFELLSQVHQQLGNFEQALYAFQNYHKTEKAIFNEANEKRTRELAVQFDVERSRHEAEEYRLRTEVLRQARDEAEAKVRERTHELEEAQLEIITRLAVAAEYRDDDTGEHTKRVGRNAAAIAYTLGWAEADVQLLFTAARLHDVGKIGISDLILHKPGKLEPPEMAKMRSHTTIGARILSAGNSPLLELAEEIALSHHERWDGRGYPIGLKGEAIPLSARIVAVADVLDALTSERPYKRAWGLEAALSEISKQAGQQFDPSVVEACCLVFGPQGFLSPTAVAGSWHETLALLKRHRARA